MKIINLVDEDFIQYKKPSMFIIFPNCSFKCGREICQNKTLAESPIIKINREEICDRYIANPLTCAMVLGGLEPFDSAQEVLDLVVCLRDKFHCQDDIVVYSGYTEEELQNSTDEDQLRLFTFLTTAANNVIIKFGRFIPDRPSIYNENLGVTLASDNQYTKIYKF